MRSLLCQIEASHISNRPIANVFRAPVIRAMVTVTATCKDKLEEEGLNRKLAHV